MFELIQSCVQFKKDGEVIRSLAVSPVERDALLSSAQARSMHAFLLYQVPTLIMHCARPF